MTIEATFETAFGAAPLASVRVPGRVNLIGEHTDYNGGLVLPMPMPRFTEVAIGPSASEADEIVSDRFDGVTRISPGQPKQDHWSDYAEGALEAARAAGWIIGPQRVAIASDLPDGAGLSSSAALIVAILKAAARSARLAPDVRAIARRAQAVECDYVGMPCGIMDQMAVAGGLDGMAMQLNTATLEFEQISIPLGWHIAVVHSGVRRSLAEGRYAERRRECAAAARALCAEHLCLLTDTQKETAQSLEPVLARRARHAWNDHERVREAVAAMRADNLPAFGEVLNKGHASLRDDFEVSTPEIDRLVEASLQAGASGARLTGGGFGGCIVAVMPETVFPNWQQAITTEHPGVSVIY